MRAECKPDRTKGKAIGFRAGFAEHRRTEAAADPICRNDSRVVGGGRLPVECGKCQSIAVAEHPDDTRTSRPQERLRPTWPIWINLSFIVCGLFVLMTQTLGLLRGEPWPGYSLLFDWNRGSWWWLGRLVVIAGWVLLVHLHVRDLLRKRKKSGADVTAGPSPRR
ncbi:hypothetical protein ACIBO5_14350 [Nonomuraea angiospora]|uniref:hypothetical protein n=1 Tax=Nonomuraea angiospora TaxID=46172 RepID=UPI0037AD220D